MSIISLIGYGITLTASSYFPQIYDDDDPHTLTYLTIAIGVVPMYSLISWLFPKVEFEDILIQTRLKKYIFSILGTLILGLIASGMAKIILG